MSSAPNEFPILTTFRFAVLCRHNWALRIATAILLLSVVDGRDPAIAQRARANGVVAIPFDVVAEDADEELEIDRADGYRHAAPALRDRVRAELANFDCAIFGGSGESALAAWQIERMTVLKRKLDAVDRACGLTDFQKTKLDLAGRGEIHAAFDRAMEKRREIDILQEIDAIQTNHLRRETELLRESVSKSGLFKAGSLFDKMALRELSAGQRRSYNVIRVVEQVGGHVQLRPRGEGGILGILLIWTPFDEAGLVHFKNLEHLHRLTLHGTVVTDDGLAQISAMTSLRHLDLSSTCITDAGMPDLAELKNLEVLNLESTQVTDAGLVHLTKLANLKEIDLSGTKVTDAGAATLREALPNLTVHK